MSHQELERIETTLRAAWTGLNSTPFLTDAALAAGDRDHYAMAARSINVRTLFDRYPTLAVWAVLIPLAENYGADGSDVYRHISNALGRDYDHDLGARNDLKTRFRQAARRLGLPVSGNKPTELFFAPLGPVINQHNLLAKAFVGMALASGPPATEDTAAARKWQRGAAGGRFPNHTRINAAITFDQSAHCARRFDAWRRGATPISDQETHLFAAYDSAARAADRRRSDLVGPPSLFWTGDTLAFEAEPSPQPQALRLAAFPTPLKGGARISLAAPWPNSVTWSYGGLDVAVLAAPTPDEIVVFDADSGTLLARLGPEIHELETTGERQVVLSRAAFETERFGPARPSRDRSVYLAWTETGDRILMVDRPPLVLKTPIEAAIWIDAPVLGRDGSRALHAADGNLRLRLDPEVGGGARILRARIGDLVRYASLDLGPTGDIQLPLAEFGLDAPADPVAVRFELLASGAAGDLAARAELATTAWIWPGLDRDAGMGDVLPLPSTFLQARSAGLLGIDGSLRILHSADHDTPILGLAHSEAVREFSLAVRGERLWQIRIGHQDRVLVPRGAQLSFSSAERHDGLQLRADDRDADLIVLGKRLKRPFFARTIFDITAEMIEAAGSADDRIALVRKSGRTDMLARLVKVFDPAEIRLDRDGNDVVLRLLPRQEVDAVRIIVEPVTGDILTGERGFGRHPVGLGLPAGCDAQLDSSDGALVLRLAPHITQAPAHRNPPDPAGGKYLRRPRQRGKLPADRWAGRSRRPARALQGAAVADRNRRTAGSTRSRYRRCRRSRNRRRP